jgi:hypothetical protein
MADYSNRLGTLKEQADIEQEDLRTQLAGLKAAREMGLKYDEYLMKKRESDNLITTRGVTAEAARTRAEAYAKAQNRPGYDHFVQEDGSILYQNKNDQNDSFIVPAKAIQAAQLKVSQRQAGAAESNAATARGRLALDQQLDPRRVAAQEATAGASVYRALNPPERSQNNVFVTPGAQQSARDLALEQMADDPEWSKFLGKTWTGRQVGPGDFSADDWADFQEALQDRINEIMSMQRGGG